MVKVFVSHAHSSELYAHAVARELHAIFGDSLDIFVSSDEHSISAGDEWLGRIKAAIRSADIIVVICSYTTMLRPWIMYETGYASALEKLIIPIRHGALKDRIDLLEAPFDRLQALHLSSARDLERLLSTMEIKFGVNSHEYDSAAVMARLSLADRYESAEWQTGLRIFTNRSAMTGDYRLRECLQEFPSLDMIAFSAQILVDTFREAFLNALERPGFQCRLVLADAGRWGGSISYRSMVSAFGSSAQTKTTQLSEVKALSRTHGCIRIKYLRSVPVLYNLWISGLSPDEPLVGHLSVYSYNVRRGGPAMRVAQPNEPLLADLRAEFDYVWDEVAVA